MGDDEAFATESGYCDYRKDVIARARGGDVLMARELATLLVAALRSRSGLPPELMDYLTDALLKISEGEDPGAAFNVKRKVGSPRGDPDEDLAIVALVGLCRRGLRNDGTSGSIDRDAKTKALDKISDETGIALDETTLNTILRKYKSSLDGAVDPLSLLSDGELRDLADISTWANGARISHK